MHETPGTKIEIFKDNIEDLFTNLNQKRMFICGDFNIDLLNPNHNKSTEEFIDSMFSMGLFLLITRPTRITSHCATLLANIFTNIMEENIKSGLLINYISDHLPVFASYNYHYKVNSDEHKIIYKIIRTENTLNYLRNELLSRIGILYMNKVNKAYKA